MNTAQLVLSGPTKQTQASITMPVMIAGAVAIIAIIAFLVLRKKN